MKVFVLAKPPFIYPDCQLNVIEVQQYCEICEFPKNRKMKYKKNRKRDCPAKYVVASFVISHASKEEPFPQGYTAL